MSLRIRTVELRAVTDQGDFGTTIPLGQGLTIIRADNTKGKSTCLQGIIYALGLERMFSPRREIPLPYAMTNSLNRDDLETTIPVVSSWVGLEIENARGEILAIKRTAKGAEDGKLIQTWSGPKLTRPQIRVSREDFFVLDPGAAVREAGFHRRLAEFMGLQLPIVPKYSGAESPLYLETIFPLLFVEQKVGWSSFPGNFPTYFGIRDMAKRSLEFVLGFETHETERVRQQLHDERRRIVELWAEHRGTVLALARRLNGRLVGVPEEPSTEWPGVESPGLEVLHRGEWVNLEVLAAEKRHQLADSEQQPVPETGEDVERLRQELAELSALLIQTVSARTETFHRLNSERLQLGVAENRLTSISEDLRRNKDAVKLRDLGSGLSSVVQGDQCPTCHQSVSGVLLGPGFRDRFMTVDENIEYLNDQKQMVTGLVERQRREIERLEQFLASLSKEVENSQDRVRVLKSALVEADTTPSIAAIEGRLTLDREVRDYRELGEAFDGILLKLRDCVRELVRVEAGLARLPTGRLSRRDVGMLRDFEEVFREMLKEFDFTTCPPEEVEISEHSYRPEREGFELGFDMSASDAIRAKWAYHLGLLEVARHGHTNHAGFLILDEPKQQSTARGSFQGLLKRASRATEAGQQVLVATSEEAARVEEYAAEIPCTLVSFDGYVIRPLAS